MQFEMYVEMYDMKFNQRFLVIFHSSHRKCFTEMNLSKPVLHDSNKMFNKYQIIRFIYFIGLYV